MELRKAKAVFGEARGNIKMILNQLKESQLELDLDGLSSQRNQMK